jgi:4-amino-4-deoxy-L-arabinose transferase-like glycosyltransferase
MSGEYEMHTQPTLLRAPQTYLSLTIFHYVCMWTLYVLAVCSWASTTQTGMPDKEHGQSELEHRRHYTIVNVNFFCWSRALTTGCETPFIRHVDPKRFWVVFYVIKSYLACSLSVT